MDKKELAMMRRYHGMIAEKLSPQQLTEYIALLSRYSWEVKSELKAMRELERHNRHRGKEGGFYG